MGTVESRSKQRKMGILHYSPPAGAQKMECDRCKKKMWLGPMQLGLLEKSPDIPKFCSWCMLLEDLQSGKRSNIAHLGGKGGSYHMDNGNIFAGDHSSEDNSN